MKLYIDDIRPAPDGWQQARTVTDAIRFIEQFGLEVDEISIDHDISYAVEVAGTQRPFPSPENFTAVARYIYVYYRERQSQTVRSFHPKLPFTLQILWGQKSWKRYSKSSHHDMNLHHE